MNADTKFIIEEALKLDTPTRALIAEALLETLDYEEDFVISSEWMEEIHQRCAAIDSGVAKLVDHESAMRQLRAKYS